MPASGAKIGKKTLFLRETVPGGGVYVAVAEVKSIGGPSQSRDAVESTNNDSPSDAAEFVPGILVAGDVSLVLNFRPEHSSHGSAGIQADMESGTVRGWKIQWPQFPNTPEMSWQGFVTGNEITSATKDLITSATKLKATGPISKANWA